MSRFKLYRKESRYVTNLCVWVPDVVSLIEMCRYDCCHPAFETESYKIERLANHNAESADHIIRLVRVARNDGPPTLDRWRSFASFVLDVRHPDETPLTDAELANLAKINHHVSRGGG